MSETYTPTRPIMGATELAAHKASAHGRDYSTSQDGYEDMEQAGKAGWTNISSWGRDGWDLGKWPYVSIQARLHDGRWELQQIVEGDHDVYAFADVEDMRAAIDYLFLWYAADEDWAPLSWEQRSDLDAGAVAVADEFRGPFSWARCDAKATA